jgi:hypothetical protein
MRGTCSSTGIPGGGSPTIAALRQALRDQAGRPARHDKAQAGDVMGRPHAVLIGQKFGRLTVVEKDGYDAHKHIVWRCRCECGGQTFASTNALRSGNSRTCGCSKRMPHACRA